MSFKSTFQGYFSRREQLQNDVAGLSREVSQHQVQLVGQCLLRALFVCVHVCLSVTKT